MSISDIIMNIGYVEGKNLSNLEHKQRGRMEINCKNSEWEEENNNYIYNNDNIIIPDKFIDKKIHSFTNIEDLEKNIICNSNDYLNDVKIDDIDVNKYYEENYRNCISRRPSIDENQNQNQNQMVEEKLLSNIMKSLPSFFIKNNNGSLKNNNINEV